MPTPAWQREAHNPPRLGYAINRGTGMSRVMRGQDTRTQGDFDQGRGRRAPPRGGRLRRIVDAPGKKVTYKISEWCRDTVLEMVRNDPFNAKSQYEYHRRQGLESQVPPLCINRRTCASQPTSTRSARTSSKMPTKTPRGAHGSRKKSPPSRHTEITGSFKHV